MGSPIRGRTTNGGPWAAVRSQCEVTQGYSASVATVQFALTQFELTQFELTQFELTQFELTQFELTQFALTQFEAVQFAAVQFAFAVTWLAHASASNVPFVTNWLRPSFGFGGLDTEAAAPASISPTPAPGSAEGT